MRETQFSPVVPGNSEQDLTVQQKSALSSARLSALSIEIQPRQALEAVVKSLYRCARIINKEPVHVVGKILDDGEEIFDHTINPQDPATQSIFEYSAELVNSLSDFYLGHALHMMPREDNPNQEYRFLVNIREIAITDESIKLQYQPNGELLEIDLSKLGIDFDITT